MSDEQRLSQPWDKLPSEIQPVDIVQSVINPAQYWEAEAQRYKEALQLIFSMRHAPLGDHTYQRAMTIAGNALYPNGL